MYLLVASWYDNCNELLRSEYYDGSSTDPGVLLTYYADCKDFYDHTVVSETEDRILFSDGTRVILELSELSTLPGEPNRDEYIDIGESSEWANG